MDANLRLLLNAWSRFAELERAYQARDIERARKVVSELRAWIEQARAERRARPRGRG